MTAARIGRWMALAAPLLLTGSLVSGGAAVAADPSAPPALDAQVAEIIDQVEALRELDRTAPIDWRLADADVALKEQLDKVTADAETVDRVRQDERILTRLGLLPPGTDLLQMEVDTLQGQVAGFYDTDTKSLTVLDTDGQLDVASRITLAHETDHALQDQRWGLDALQNAVPKVEEDRASAIQALVEGDATLLMTLWAAKHAAGDLMGLDGAGLPGGDSLDGLPQVVQRQLLFPYLDGLTFLMRAWGPGGWDAVNAIWDAPPVSTEQVMHPEKYPDELPVQVTLPDLAASLGDGWTQTGETVMGELNTGIFVADGAPWDPTSFSLAGQVMPNAAAAAGWGGDRAVTLDGPDGAWALAWQTTWDTPADAAEFTAAAQAAMADLPGAWTVAPLDLTADGLAAPVAVLVADSAETLATAQAAWAAK